MLIPYVQYGLVQYGLYPYGRYELTSNAGYNAGAQPRMRIRSRTATGGIGIWVETQQLEQAIPGYFPHIRMRTQNGEWVYLQSVGLPKWASKIRIRAISNDGNTNPWVLYEEANLEEG